MQKNTSLSSEHGSLVSIGLPVYNGENYLKQAIDSILCQTFTNFELIISDNASTDRTESICRAYAASDNRIHYVRNIENKGATWNFNRVFELSSGKYFKWISHDDVYKPEFIEKCLSFLELDSNIILCSTRAVDIDESGEVRKKNNFPIDTQSYRAYIRFYDLICKNHPCLSIFGLIKAKVLKDTSLIGNYVGSDRVLLAELGIRGRFYEYPEALFLHREHSMRSTRLYQTLQSRIIWFDPKKKTQFVFPNWRLFFEYFLLIKRSSSTRRQKLVFYFLMPIWLKQNLTEMMGDLVFFIKQIYYKIRALGGGKKNGKKK